MTRTEPEDQKTRIINLRRDAAAGNATAQRDLAFEYEIGLNIENDPEKAAQWYKQAALQGDAIAQNSYGDCLRYGSGVKQNLVKCVNWYRQASESQPIAKTNLAMCYYEGIGIEKDSSKAILLLCQAAQQQYGQAAREKLSEGRVFTGRYNIEFQASNPHNTPLTKQQIIEVVIPAMKRVGRAKSDASTIIGNLVQFSFKQGIITTEAELVEIRNTLTENTPGLNPEKSKSCLMIKGCIDATRERITSETAISGALAAEPDNVARVIEDSPPQESPSGSTTAISSEPMAPGRTSRRQAWS